MRGRMNKVFDTRRYYIRLYKSRIRVRVRVRVRVRI